MPDPNAVKIPRFRPMRSKKFRYGTLGAAVASVTGHESDPAA
jgi:hypothetical protein